MRCMSNYSVEKVLKEWVDESRIPEPIQFSYGKGELFIYTSRPGYLIGKAGTLYNKYKDKLMSEFDDLNSVHIVEVHLVRVRTTNEMRSRIRELCYSRPNGCEGCPYDKDESSWCNKGKWEDIPEDQVYEVLRVMEVLCNV